MGGRGNGGARNSLEDKFGGRLGTRKSVDKVKKMKDLLDGQLSPYNKSLIKSLVNPEYNALQRNKYSKNCALCTVATALQLSGYDVEAMPRDVDWRGVPDVYDIDFTNKNNYILGTHLDYNSHMPQASKIRKNGRELNSYQTYANGRKIENIQTMPNDAGEAHRVINEKVKSWGNGAFGEMTISWKNGGAHSVLIYNDNGTAKVYDSQSHKNISTLGSYLQRTNVGMTQIFRLDNAPIKSNVNSNTLSKMVKRRDGKAVGLTQASDTAKIAEKLKRERSKK